MPRTILVPLDGSLLAERALDYATALAMPADTRLVLLRVEIAYSLADIPDDRARAAAVTRAEQYLAEVCSRLTGRGFAVDSEVRSAGRAAEAIVEAAADNAAGMIVMASHGRTGPRHLLFGSVAESVVAHSRVPVLVERAWQPAQRELLIEGKPRLLVPLDGSLRAEAALEVATELAREFDGEVVLLAVDVPSDVESAEQDVAEHFDATVPEPQFDADEYLARVEERQRAASPNIPVHHQVRRGQPAEQIVRTATEIGAALVVMTTHGRTGVQRLIAGSVAGRVIEHGQEPVVLIGPAALAARQEPVS